VDDLPTLISIPVVCRELGDLSRSRLYQILNDPSTALTRVHIGRRSFVPRASLLAYLRQLEEAEGQEGAA
jgi:hypothetical protein